jgi:signal peptidase II
MPPRDVRPQNKFLPHKYVVFFLIVSIITLMDQFSKWAVSTRIPLHGSVVVIKGFLNLVHVRNTGIAFGIFSGSGMPYRALFLTLVSLTAMVFIFVCVRRLHAGQLGWLVGISLVFGGALGNFIDRALYGEVIDFIDCYLGRFHWPAFNVADSAVTIGVSYLALKTVRKI